MSADKPEDSSLISRQYREYQKRLSSIGTEGDISENGFVQVEDQTFPMTLGGVGEVSLSLIHIYPSRTRSGFPAPIF